MRYRYLDGRPRSIALRPSARLRAWATPKVMIGSAATGSQSSRSSLISRFVIPDQPPPLRSFILAYRVAAVL